jgi:hypothetical protein
MVLVLVLVLRLAIARGPVATGQSQRMHTTHPKQQIDNVTQLGCVLQSYHSRGQGWKEGRKAEMEVEQDEMLHALDPPATSEVVHVQQRQRNQSLKRSR